MPPGNILGEIYSGLHPGGGGGVRNTPEGGEGVGAPGKVFEMICI